VGISMETNLDIVAGGNISPARFRPGTASLVQGRGKGGWRLIQESGLPTRGLPLSGDHSRTIAIQVCEIIDPQNR